VKAWETFIQPLVDKMSRVWNKPEKLICQWEKFVEKYQYKSFYQVLNENGLSKQEIQYFGLIGLGTGGFDWAQILSSPGEQVIATDNSG
jgi:hypothetical protein